jgi:hypothetical protein
VITNEGGSMLVRLKTRSIRRLAIFVVGFSISTTILELKEVWADGSLDSIKVLQTLQSGDDSALAASKAIKQLGNASDVTLIQSLTAMKGATPLGRNWLSGLANSLYRKSGKSQTAELTKFLEDASQDGEARYLVFQWLTTNNDVLRKKLLADMSKDTSPELRFLAIEEAMKVELERGDLTVLLKAARHPSQVVSLIEKLKAAGITIDQSRQLGFLPEWRLIGPFDNVGTANFDKVFEVETDWAKGAVKDEYQGKTEAVTWTQHTTAEPDGVVDLAQLYNKEKGCIIYAAAEFDSEKDQDAEVRLGCINGNKIWVNGKLVMSNEVYHTGAQIDQYAEPIHLKAGKNQILVKVCQNEQKEQWAQDYKFQLRICDSTGKAILTKGR